MGPEADAAYHHFFTTPLAALRESGLSGAARERAGRERALGLFHAAAERVPAYRRFLAAHDCDPAAIRAPEDFGRIPIMDKAAYLVRHPLPDLCWDGRLPGRHMISVSSGSTGRPFFWPRGYEQELSTAVAFEEIYREIFQAHERATLVVVCFAMGTWIAGTFTAQASALIAQKGYPITVITPGLNRDEILRAVRELGPHFDQVVLAGYPPFVKDVLDAGRAAGIDWPAYHIRMIWAGEVFSEEWRAHVHEIAGVADPLTGSAALYGSADAAVLGHEWPLSVALRRFAAGRPDRAAALFGEPRLPSLLQYDPCARYFETVAGELVFSAHTGIPLIRYNIHDTGGVIPAGQMLAWARSEGCDPDTDLPAAAPDLPFVYVFGRSDFTISYYGANIYPENIKAGLEDPRVRARVTGKFVMYVMHDDARRERLALHVELAPGAAPDTTLPATLTGAVLDGVRRQNSEFANYVPAEAQTPALSLHAAGDPAWFAPGLKHRYTRPPA
jgi:phenylacetate-CoA ligase